jgi:hypothetical protein
MFFIMILLICLRDEKVFKERLFITIIKFDQQCCLYIFCQCSGFPKLNLVLNYLSYLFN